MKRPKVICLGASAGGVAALQTILRDLPGGVFPPVVSVLHLPSAAIVDFQLAFHQCRNVKEAVDKMPLEPGNLYFAPPDHHVLVEKEYLSVTQDDPVHFSRPSIDVLFESAAWSYGDEACGVVLSGANRDGADGLRAIGRAGGMTVVQDPHDAEMAIMPQAALDACKPDFVLPLKDIAAQVIKVVHGG